MRMRSAEHCPSADKHTPCPQEYSAWQSWASWAHANGSRQSRCVLHEREYSIAQERALRARVELEGVLERNVELIEECDALRIEAQRWRSSRPRAEYFPDDPLQDFLERTNQMATRCQCQPDPITWARTDKYGRTCQCGRCRE
jgi:hypothetical protein